MDAVELIPLKRISHPKGDIYHALKDSDVGFAGFGEAYFTTILSGETKGWKKHRCMTMNLIVPVGVVCFYLHDDVTGESASFELGDGNYQRLSVGPGVWMAFKGIGVGLNLVLNIANIPHDPEEAINVPLEAFPL
jgi:dTDP-4-dehydrorhamnose 3,5-epimerase